MDMGLPYKTFKQSLVRQDSRVFGRKSLGMQPSAQLRCGAIPKSPREEWEGGTYDGVGWGSPE